MARDPDEFCYQDDDSLSDKSLRESINYTDYDLEEEL
jgi:hypothetical protein